MARVLSESWRRFHSGCPLFVLLLDSPSGFFSPEKEDFVPIATSDLAIRNLDGFLFKYSVLEASTAVKPYLLNHLFQSHGIEKLLYLDPDILITGSLDTLRSYLDHANVLLTPHLLSPLPEDECRQSDHDILKSGAYNLGFLGLRNSAETQRLLTWWSEKLYHHCRVAIEQNLFVDQRWMDLAPGLFEGVRILREPGLNVAYWNLHERSITVGDTILVNGEPLRFFHFSGFEADKPWIVSKHQDRFQMTNIGEASILYERYREMLADKGWNETRTWKYGHDYFSNGARIPLSARRYYWSLGADVEHLGNPFEWMQDKSRSSSATGPKPMGDLEGGINLMGYYQAETGVGEGARSNLRIVQASGIPYVVNNWVDRTSQNVEAIPEELTKENPYSANLLTINADRLEAFAEEHTAYLQGRYNIGYWAWELPEFPQEWESSFGYVDEIWTPSRFTRDSIETRSPVPVKVVPHAMDMGLANLQGCARSSFGLSDGVFLFLFMFDFHSYLARKNPLGLIKAYKKAFGSRQDVQLVLKATHGTDHPKDLAAVHSACEGANVRIIDSVLTREECQQLTTVADSYVSLHRSEGFGLTMAEAMMCEKPVIATAYSGNVDFMSDDDSFLVPYKLVTIEKSSGPYKAGYHWAEPDLDYAVDIMRYVKDHPEAAAKTGSKASSKVRELLHPSSIAVGVRSRIEELGLLTNKASASR